MDSLAANYASSDDDEPAPRNPNPTPKPSSLSPSKSLFASLPPPKSSSSPSSLFSSLPPPKTTTTTSSSSSTSSSYIFSSLPPPKSDLQRKPANAKRVVHFKPPINPALLKSLDDEDEDDKTKEKKKRVSDFSSKSLSAVIPPPKNSLCLAPVASSSSAPRSAVVADAPVLKPEVANDRAEEKSGLGECEGHYGSWGGGSEVEGQWSVNAGDGGGSGDVISTSWAASDGTYHANYDSYGGEWDYSSTSTVAVENSMPQISDMQRVVGKRGRNEIPSDIVEVQQDELMKNRPREDQTKLTGIAFGPAYQPVSSQNGKPSKLHKRKHQITSLYFDMKQKESELSERRSRGMVTKRETQGKYGW